MLLSSLKIWDSVNLLCESIHSYTVNYVRRTDLEGINSNLIIIDLEGTSQSRIINVYRSFSTQTGTTQREKFKYQLTLIKHALQKMNCILLGDFNLNYAKINDVDYSHVRYFDDFDDILMMKT